MLCLDVSESNGATVIQPTALTNIHCQSSVLHSKRLLAMSDWASCWWCSFLLAILYLSSSYGCSLLFFPKCTGLCPLSTISYPLIKALGNLGRETDEVKCPSSEFNTFIDIVPYSTVPKSRRSGTSKNWCVQSIGGLARNFRPATDEIFIWSIVCRFKRKYFSFLSHSALTQLHGQENSKVNSLRLAFRTPWVCTCLLGVEEVRKRNVNEPRIEAFSKLLPCILW